MDLDPKGLYRRCSHRGDPIIPSGPVPGSYRALDGPTEAGVGSVTLPPLRCLTETSVVLVFSRGRWLSWVVGGTPGRHRVGRSG